MLVTSCAATLCIAPFLDLSTNYNKEYIDIAVAQWSQPAPKPAAIDTDYVMLTEKSVMHELSVTEQNILRNALLGSVEVIDDGYLG